MSLGRKSVSQSQMRSLSPRYISAPGQRDIEIKRYREITRRERQRDNTKRETERDKERQRDKARNRKRLSTEKDIQIQRDTKL